MVYILNYYFYLSNATVEPFTVATFEPTCNCADFPFIFDELIFYVSLPSSVISKSYTYLVNSTLSFKFANIVGFCTFFQAILTPPLY